MILAAHDPARAGDAPILLDENFTAYRPGIFYAADGALTEYHYVPEAAPQGNWVVSTFRSGAESQRAWRVVAHDGRPAMWQSSTNKEAHSHPMLLTGDPAWSDCTVEVEFTPEREDARSGIALRYRNDRCYYFFGVEKGQAVLRLVRHETAFRKPFEKVLAETPCDWKPGDRLTAKVSVDGAKISARLADGRKFGVAIDATDDTFATGKVALLADVPTLYHRIQITTTREAKAAIDAVIAKREAQEAALQAANPKPVLWRKIKTDGFGVGRNLRFGDLDGDGQLDILIGQVHNRGPKDSNSEVGCLTALDLDGKKLWQNGNASTWADKLTNDVAFQVHDLDGDGQTEVVYVRELQITVAEGATGRTIRQTPSPETPPRTPPPFNRFPRILGDAIHFCDLRGKGHDSDFILKDRYRSVWALDDKLNVLWHGQCTTGHYPFAADIDGDGRDEVQVGYTLFDDDGTQLWTLDGRVKDHADGVAWVRFRPDDPLRLICAGSDEGLFFADTAGNIQKHHRIGHAQNISVADFRPDLPGLEAVSINFWGNQGLVHFYDADGNIYHDCEPAQHGSMCLPVNWTGQPGEFFVLSVDVREGGMFDGRGHRVVRFPADGHPDKCYTVLDLTGDARDEIVVWDPSEIWIYTQEDSPREGRLYKPTRNPLYNESNYRANVSLPGWTK
jgi:hypothetical protein